MSINCAQLSVNHDKNIIEMKILESEKMLSQMECVDNVGDNIIRAAHVIDETIDTFMESNIMKVLREEGNTIFMFDDFGNNKYNEVAVFKMHGLDYKRLHIGNRKDNEVLIRVEDNRHFTIVDINAENVKRHGVEHYITNGFTILPNTDNEFKVYPVSYTELYFRLGKRSHSSNPPLPEAA